MWPIKQILIRIEDGNLRRVSSNNNKRDHFFESHLKRKHIFSKFDLFHKEVSKESERAH